MANLLKANELRIGNYVTLCQINDEYIEFDMPVAAINSDNTIRLTTNNGEIGCFHIKQIKSIPITYWWLDKFGIDNGSIKIDKRFCIRIGEGISYNQEEWICNCEYVHQLQNIYFYLTGEELKLN